MSQTKVCTKCDNEYPSTSEYFFRKKQSKDGLSAQCKKCSKKYQKKRREKHKNYWQDRNPYNAEETKKCSKCGKEYPKTEEYWHKDSTNKYGLHKDCNGCHMLRNTEYRKNNKEKVRKRGKNRKLKQRYGITLEQYNTMFEEQRGCCAICGAHQSEFQNSLHVDHNHKTGKVRALLCTNCNTALGFLEDDEFVKKAKTYLKKYGLL